MTTRPRVTRVPESNYGLYLWRFPDGSFAKNDEGDYLNIPAKRGDRERVSQLLDAVRYWFGTEAGKAVFVENRRVTDDEYDEQKLRMQFGLVPDPLDSGAIKDEIRWRAANGN